MLNATETTHLCEVLRRAADLLSNRRCNDFLVPNTDENWAIEEEMAARNYRLTVAEWRKHREYKPRPTEDEINFYDWRLCHNMAAKLGEGLRA